MHKRILVPFDGLALAEVESRFSSPFTASSLVDGLETEIEFFVDALTDGVQREGIQTFSLLHEISTADVNLAAADTIQIDSTTVFVIVPAYSAG